jgi:hypothetical protein
MSDLFKLSVSKSKVFANCKKQYEFSYVLKMPRKEFEYHQYGKFCHRILELFHIECMKDYLFPMHKAMSKSFNESVKEFTGKLTPEMKQEAIGMCQEYLKILIDQKKNNKLPTVLACEQDFELILDNKIKVVGVIDKIETNDDNIIHIADYKTTKNKKYLKDDWFQLLTYAYVILEKVPDLKEIRASYILCRHNFEHITKTFYVDEILAVKDMYLKYAEQMLTEKEFTPNPTFMCNFCEFLEHCDEGKKKVQPDKTFGEVSW